MNEQNHQQILFRGFHPCEDGDTTIYVEGEAVKGRWVEGFLSKSRDMSEKPCVLKYCIDHEENDVMFSAIILPSTVCPYTGLTDKNGRKIFKGDIILAKDIGYKAVVEWQVDTCRFLAIIINRRDPQSPHFFYVDKGNDRGCQMSSNEVIDTIFDKPKEATP